MKNKSIFTFLFEKCLNSAKLHTLLKIHFLTTIPLLFRIGHFYSPIVNPRELKKRVAHLWRNDDEMGGVDLRQSEQLALLELLKHHTGSIDYPIQRPKSDLDYFYSNDQFPGLDAQFLHSLLCCLKPRVMIEVGCGFSSLVTAHVNRHMLNGAIDFTCIEPYPRKFLIDGVPGITRLIQKKLEDVELSFFDRLDEGDILFIDSSHVSKTGSDVNYLFFEILPRLRKGVMVHFHDIFLPDEYPQKWVIDQGRNWNEQYLLRAFLQYNSNWEVIWSAHFMGTRYPSAVQETFPSFPQMGGGGSFWIKRN
jgi:hypothetical protein